MYNKVELPNTAIFDSIVPEDSDQYKEALKEFSSLSTENIVGNNRMMMRSLVLADRWNDISTYSKFIAGETGALKSDFYNYAYRRHRELIKIHEVCKARWKLGEDKLKYVK